MTQVESDAYSVANSSDMAKEDIMSAIKGALDHANSGGTDISQVKMTEDPNGTLSHWGLDGKDIASGGGALLLDSVLQKLSTMEQVSGQMLAAVYKAVKQINQQLGQG